jgi:hypothetical protein
MFEITCRPEKIVNSHPDKYNDLVYLMAILYDVFYIKAIHIYVYES